MAYQNGILKWIDEENNLSVTERLFSLSLFLIAFVIPFGGIVVSYFIAISVTLFLICLFQKRKLQFTKSGFILLFASFYLLHLIGMTYTQNSKAGWTDLGLKISLLLFTALFAASASFIQINIEKILVFFTAGCTVAGICCLIIASLNYVQVPMREQFFYMRLSWFMHPAYFSMYLNFALVFLGWQRIKSDKTLNIKSAISYPLILFITLLIVLLASKIGNITMVILILTYAILLLTKRSKLKTNLLFLFVTIIFLTSLFLYLRNSTNRFFTIKHAIEAKDIDKGTTESTAIRKLVWQTSVTLLKENWLCGVGSGDVSDVLKSEYSRLGITGAYKESLNAHNQYLQTWLGLGIAGLIVLLLLIFLTMYYSIKERNHLLTFFLILVALNFLTESMLQRQAGVVFFSFFSSLLIFYKNRDLPES